MDEPFLVILSGPPGAGKSTVGRSVADRFNRSACLESDWFWTTIVNGFVLPWEKEADDQNRAVLAAVVAAATRLVRGGYTTVVEGVVGPWHFDLVRDELHAVDIPTHYLALRPDLSSCLARAKARAGTERIAGHPPLTEEGAIRLMWDRFADLGVYEPHVIDSTGLSVRATTDVVLDRLESGDAVLSLRGPGNDATGAGAAAPG
jgi:predicted kinase